MNEREEKRGPRKRPYVKPKMRRVELRPQEAVLGACKTSTGTSGGGTAGSCSAISCMSQGS